MLIRKPLLGLTLMLVLSWSIFSSTIHYSLLPITSPNTHVDEYVPSVRNHAASFSLDSPNIPPPQPGDNWTVLVYLDGDNDLEESAFIDLNAMELIGSTVDVRIIVYVDFCYGVDAPFSGAKCYEVTQDANTAVINSLELSTTLPTEPDMGDWHTLRDFLVFGQSYAPADQYLVVIWDHGSGCLGLCVDDTSGTAMDIRDLRFALNDSMVQHLDIVAFDACLMGQIEVAYEIRNVADYLVFSEEGIPLDGFPYDEIFQDLTSYPDQTPAQLAGIMVSLYTAAYDVGGQYYDPFFNFVCLSAVNSSQIASVVYHLKNLTAELATSIQSLASSSDVYDRVCQALAMTQTFSSPEFVDLAGFATELSITLASNPTINTSAQCLADAITRCVMNESHLSGTPGATGLSIYTADYGSNPLLLADESQWDEFIEEFLDFGGYSSSACLISPTGTHYGYLDGDDDSVYFIFTPLTSAYYTIALAPAWPYYDSDFDLYLYDYGLNELEHSLSTDSTEEIYVYLSVGSTYFLEVYSYPSTTGAGAFLITFSGGGPTTPTLPFDATLLGALIAGIFLAVFFAIIVVVLVKRRTMPEPPSYTPTYAPARPTPASTETVRFCAFCGALLPAKAQYCPTCGASTMRD